MTALLRAALSVIPKQLLDPLLSEYEEGLRAARSRDWEKVGLKAGKLCETIYCVLLGYTSGSYPSVPFKPKNMVADCVAFEKCDDKKFSRSVRIQIPRVLIAAYELRNNRAIGHVSGDIDPNEMDELFFIRSIKWMIGELVRQFYICSVDEARKLVEVVSERDLPIIWDVDGVIRVLDSDLSTKDKSLLILYYKAEKMKLTELMKAILYLNSTNFRKNIIKPLHNSAMVHLYDGTREAIILPPGIKYVEDKLLS